MCFVLFCPAACITSFCSFDNFPKEAGIVIYLHFALLSRQLKIRKYQQQKRQRHPLHHPIHVDYNRLYTPVYPQSHATEAPARRHLVRIVDPVLPSAKGSTTSVSALSDNRSRAAREASSSCRVITGLDLGSPPPALAISSNNHSVTA